MTCIICQGSISGHEAWCPMNERSLIEDRSAYIIGVLQRFATEGLPINLDPERPKFKTIEECDAWWKNWFQMADGTLRRIADTSLSSIPQAIRDSLTVERQ